LINLPGGAVGGTVVGLIWFSACGLAVNESVACAPDDVEPSARSDAINFDIVETKS
jgi:hypothetical protein